MIDQKGCVYTPHVVTLQVGQVLDIKNSDGTTHNIHNIHSNSQKNVPFNIAQATAGLVSKQTFRFPEIFPVKCDVHLWISAWVGVFDHPYFDVTAKDGTFEITGLAACAVGPFPAEQGT